MKTTNNQTVLDPSVNRLLSVDPTPPLCICPQCGEVVDPLKDSVEGRTDEQRLIEGLSNWSKASLMTTLKNLPVTSEYTLARGIIIGLLNAA